MYYYYILNVTTATQVILLRIKILTWDLFIDNLHIINIQYLCVMTHSTYDSHCITIVLTQYTYQNLLH